ncbi:transposase [Streptomyces sp. NPDC102473]|uniref:transposase n=1 Tax=Streptomyces sp. NPDC102473 TaxID=3366180 RepID=UPI00382D423F
MSLLPDAVRREALAEASRFRGEFYECLSARCDELFELVDAMLCADGAVKTSVDLTLLPEHRRGHGAMYGGLSHGRIDADQLRVALAGLSLPRFDGGRLVLAVDVSPWLRSDAPCSADRLFCHVYGRAKTASQFIPGWPYSFVAVLEPGATPWPQSWMRLDDATAARNEGIGTCFQHFPDVEVLLDDGYLGLRCDHPGQAVTPPRKGNKISPPEVLEARLRARHRHSSKRITVEHALADHKRWKQLTRWTHRRENLPATYRAIASLVSDRNTTD